MKHKWQKQLDNSRGSTLTWALVMLVVLLIFVGSVLTLAMGVNRQDIASNTEKQAYYTARSVVNAAAQDICNGDTELLNEAKDGEIISLPVNGLASNMGTCQARIYRTGNVLAIEATATVADSSVTVCGRLDKEISFGETPTGFTTPSFLSTTKAISNMEVDGNLYIQPGTEAVELKGDDNRFNITGTLYSRAPLTISGSSTPSSRVDGSIISSQDVIFSDSCNALVGEKLDPNGFSVRTSGNLALNNSAVQLNGKIQANSVTMNYNTYTNNTVGTINAKTVTLSGNTRLYADIVADEVTINGQVQLTGNIRAQKVTINLASTTGYVKGNIEATTLAVSGQSTLTGTAGNAVSTGSNVTVGSSSQNFHAGTCTLSGNARLTGNIVAPTVTMSGATSITGLVTGNTVNISGTTNVNGGVRASTSLTINNSSGARVATGAESPSVVIQYSTRQAIGGAISTRRLTIQNVQYTDLATLTKATQLAVTTSVVTFKAVTLTKTAFTSPRSINLTPPDISFVMISGLARPQDSLFENGLVMDNGLLTAGKYDEIESTTDAQTGQIIETVTPQNTYYSVNVNTTASTLEIRGNGNVFIFVPNGVIFHINSIRYRPDEQSSYASIDVAEPHLFIVAQAGATVDLAGNSQNYYCYLYGETGSSIILNAGTYIHGGLFADSLTPGKSCRIDPIPPNVNDDNLGKNSWVFTKYISTINDIEGGAAS